MVFHTNETIQSAKTPAHQAVYSRLRHAILFGDYAPGQALTIHSLTQDLKAGMTPVREALRRLTAEAAIEMLGNRRIQVPVLDRSQIEQLLFLRTCLEPELGARAALQIDNARIAALEKLDQSVNAAIDAGDVQSYLRSNHAFHQNLYAVAKASEIQSTVDRLWLRFGPPLRVVCGRFGTLNLPDQHSAILSGLRAKDPVSVAAAIRADIEQGATMVIDAANAP